MRKALILTLVAITTVFIFHSTLVISEEASTDDFYNEVELFTDVLSLIRADYVEETKYKDLIYGALKGMMRSLDDYSQFLTPDEYKEVRVETEGEFGGLGIEITIKDGLLTIIAPIDDTPAFKAGVKSNDRIVKIDGELTKDITLMEAVKKLRGVPGSEVSLTILREAAERLLDITIVRDIIKVKSIRRAKLFGDGIGYIRLTEFQERSADELEENLRKLEDLGMDSLVLDLRNNPGGLLDSAVKVSEKFIPSGKVIVSTQGRKSHQEMVFHSKRGTKHRTYPMVVLVSGGSASGSEIVAGAIKDYKRGILLGTKTFGKGSVQTVIPLSDGSALRLTTSKYFTPSGRCIHEEGIEPDVEVEFQERPFDEASKEKTVFKKVEEQEKKQEQEKKEEKKEEEKEEDKAKQVKISLQDYMQDIGFYDNQLVRAVDLLKGIKLYNRHQDLVQTPL